MILSVILGVSLVVLVACGVGVEQEFPVSDCEQSSLLRDKTLALGQWKIESDLLDSSAVIEISEDRLRYLSLVFEGKELIDKAPSVEIEFREDFILVKDTEKNRALLSLDPSLSKTLGMKIHFRVDGKSIFLKEESGKHFKKYIKIP